LTMTQWGLDTLFNPAKRHMDEEKQRLQSTREEVGDSSGGKRIDLESGKVTISRGGKTKVDPDDDAAPPVDEPDADDGDDDAAVASADAEGVTATTEHGAEADETG
jgi:uncharacterized protein DUF6191